MYAHSRPQLWCRLSAGGPFRIRPVGRLHSTADAGVRVGHSQVCGGGRPIGAYGGTPGNDNAGCRLNVTDDGVCQCHVSPAVFAWRTDNFRHR